MVPLKLLSSIAPTSSGPTFKGASQQLTSKCFKRSLEHPDTHGYLMVNSYSGRLVIWVGGFKQWQFCMNNEMSILPFGPTSARFLLKLLVQADSGKCRDRCGKCSRHNSWLQQTVSRAPCIMERHTQVSTLTLPGSRPAWVSINNSRRRIEYVYMIIYIMILWVDVDVK